MNTFTRISLCGAMSAVLVLSAAPLASATIAVSDAQVEVAPLSQPGPVTHAKVKAKRTRLKVSWRPPSSGPVPTGYQVNAAGRGWVDANGLKMTVKGLTPSTRYTVKIRSCINRVYSTPVTKHKTTKA